MKHKYQVPLLEEELYADISKNIVETKLSRERDNLFYNYDDSSDDEETLDYGKEIKSELSSRIEFLQSEINAKITKINDIKKCLNHKEYLEFLESYELALNILIEFNLQESTKIKESFKNQLRLIAKERIKINKFVLSLSNEELADQDSLKLLLEGNLINISNRDDDIKKFLETSKIQALKEELKSLTTYRQTLENELLTVKDIKNDKESYLMEIEGRKAIYENRTEYKKRKYETLGKVTLEVKDATFYNQKLVSILVKKGLITKEQADTWQIIQQQFITALRSMTDDSAIFVQMLELNDKVFFNEENKFHFLRKFLRQTNREVIDKSLLYEVKNFVCAFAGKATVQINHTTLKTIAKEFIIEAQLSAKRPTLNRTRVNPDIESVRDFYAEEMLKYRSLTRSSREIAGKDLEIAQTMVFDGENDLVSQKKQIISKDDHEKSSKTHLPHRGTVEEEVFNLGSYQNILARLTLMINQKLL